MPSTRTHDILATVGRYKHEGKRMKRSVRVGSGFTDPQGRLYLRLDSVPICPEWSGWLTVQPVRRCEEVAPLLPFEEEMLGDALDGCTEDGTLASSDVPAGPAPEQADAAGAPSHEDA